MLAKKGCKPWAHLRPEIAAFKMPRSQNELQHNVRIMEYKYLKYSVHCLVWTDDLPCQGADLNFRALLPLVLQENYIFSAQRKTNFCQP